MLSFQVHLVQYYNSGSETRRWNIHRTGAGVDRRVEDLDTDAGKLKYLTGCTWVVGSSMMKNWLSF
ncbi:hypothetical protein PVAP13_6KG054180 [Panicum virgatum]|uniref:Uncharacterized protein n=1 Tax=Panicum virgatum TaxID=38727 RepID=A0A8T0RA55_PANVG|nr:hypothetical protein PVAP13_6KG054180 [Panicum virgatum]